MGIFNNLTGWHLLVIVFLVLLLFGAPKLPALARSMGQSMRIFKNEIKTNKDDDGTEATKAESTEKSGSDTPTTKP